MGHIEAIKDLATGADELWATVSDPHTWGDWFTVHDRWLEEPPAVLSEGAKLTAKIVMLGMANKIDWTVETVHAPTTLVLGGTGMAGVKARFAFTISPRDDGSTIAVTGDFEGALIKGAMAKAVEKDGVKQLDTSLEKLQTLATAKA
ncbi:SRPBCC family protein [Mycolicibacterium sp. 3033]|nr:SRPBCC family protein [Mycolicibacterium aurantiacum]